MDELATWLVPEDAAALDEVPADEDGGSEEDGGGNDDDELANTDEDGAALEDTPAEEVVPDDGGRRELLPAADVAAEVAAAADEDGTADVDVAGEEVADEAGRELPLEPPATEAEDVAPADEDDEDGRSPCTQRPSTHTCCASHCDESSHVASGMVGRHATSRMLHAAPTHLAGRKVMERVFTIGQLPRGPHM